MASASEANGGAVQLVFPEFVQEHLDHVYSLLSLMVGLKVHWQKPDVCQSLFEENKYGSCERLP